MAFKSFLKFIGCRQNSKPELFFFRVDVSENVNGTNAAIDEEGKSYATVTKNGNGDYTITLNRKARRPLHVVGISTESDTIGGENASTTNNSARIITRSRSSGTATDADFCVTLAAFYGKTQR